MFIRRRGVMHRASLFADVFVLMMVSVSTQAAAGLIRVEAHYDAVAERHREERLRDERLWEERQQDTRRQQAIRNDYHQRAERAQRAHESSERKQPD
jgi:hypothetical protein